MTSHDSVASSGYRSLIIDCLRHGECEGARGLRGQQDVELTCDGRAAMHASGARLPKPDRLLSSPLTRCRSVAVELAEQWGLECRIDDDLMEMHFGEWEGRSLRELADREPEALAAFWRDPARAAPPGGEPLDAFETRVERAWQHCLAAPVQHQLIVTHGGVIKTWLAKALKMETRQAMHLHRLEVAHSGVMRLRVELLPGEAPLAQLLFLGVPGASMTLPSLNSY
ncbi:alpha-ribazole phosphatase [Kushneria sinocarnis]|uniref:Alpha-ribazole phosphatase n=1 Tax=Kushneria sinocarnis TaxID=595502 RepID=A0A420WYM4_9GAMM|nr:alpha-ribazole phosphatase family protein [Kushneria sinocarnis]RKR06260.1 alpha-ribazole phosphatase [Kushneria sinocarnis]